MAVVKQPYSCSMKMKYQNGVNAQGEPVYVNRTFSRIKTSASDQDLFELSQAINSLQEDTLAGVYRVDDGELISE